jgi:NAD(P)-dependent dehydrogenase (short-subunit alcohol dehydrogenase family)
MQSILPKMNKKNIVIVGGSDGIGRAIANALAKENTVIIIGRSVQKARDFVKAYPQNGKYLLADISLLNTIPTLVSEIQSMVDSVDYIVHSADVLRVKRLNTEEGLEQSIAINYYSRVLFNQLLIDAGSSITPNRIIHIAVAGFKPPKDFIQSFPLPEKASSFKGHAIGQVTNDFYALLLKEKLAKKGVKINVLNPGFVSTDIRRKGEFPSFVKKLIFPLLRLVWRRKTRSPEEYGEIPVSIIQGENEDADSFVLIDEKGKGIQGKESHHDAEVQKTLYEFTTRTINGILKINRVETWL